MHSSPRASGAGGGAIFGAALAITLALACTSAPVAAQEVYKSVDAEGHVVYSDRGTTKDAPKSAVRVDEPDPAEVARLAKEQEVLKAAELVRERQQASDDKKKATEEHRKEVACQSARNYYLHLRDLNRIYHDDTAGNRRWYSDEEADALREHARQAMTAACGS
jgi:hypothetical protein